MAIDAVLFDFSGTLFRLDYDESWVDDLRAADGRVLDEHERAEILHRMTTPVEQTVELDERARTAWERRDLDPRLHREVYLEILRLSGLARAASERTYDRMVDPRSWSPYPDAGEVLKAVRAQGIPVAVVSNIAFDLRPVFAAHGWDVDLFALSYEVGAMKPDPKIFRWALDRLGVPAKNALMVGDSAENDGAATALGMSFALVDPLPEAQRPTGLLDAMAAHSVLAGS